MAGDQESTEALLDRAGQGDRSAVGRLLDRHRDRLRRLVARKLDRGLSARVDPSDIVQEALADAGRRLPDYLDTRPMGFVTWLRRLALQRLDWCRRLHLGAGRRSVVREAHGPCGSAPAILDGLPGDGTSPSGHAVRGEERAWIRTAVASLPDIDREVLALRYDEGLGFAEVAARLGIGIGAAQMRHLRALERLQDALVGTAPDETSP